MMRPLTANEVAAMWFYHNEYAALGIGAIEYYKGLSVRDKKTVTLMVKEILKAAGEVKP